MDNLSVNLRAAMRTGIVFALMTALAIYFFSGIGNETIRVAAKTIGSDFNEVFVIAFNLAVFVWCARNAIYSAAILALLNDIVHPLVIGGFQLYATYHLNNIAWLMRPEGFDYAGFPSSHTAYAFASALAIATLYPRLSWLGFGCAALISWSRVPALAHKDFQVIAGLVFGLVVGWLIISFWLKRKEYIDGRLKTMIKNGK